ncbi:unnamed protein product [Lactuca virosa]|uniref:Uncharacterized protein n=1 Tax=Lactuca virosa TaxID=75947 RepID=A0AAU9P0G8_9ASTR|nr:unnamed protein product [Lactuca virosa]
MISPKKLARITRNWQNLAALRPKRIAVPRVAGCADFFGKGCFVVYTCDEIRFVVPLDYLKNEIFKELLEIAEEEYGSQRDGPIKLPFKATFMQYTVSVYCMQYTVSLPIYFSLLEKQMGKDLEEEFRTTITS